MAKKKITKSKTISKNKAPLDFITWISFSGALSRLCEGNTLAVLLYQQIESRSKKSKLKHPETKEAGWIYLTREEWVHTLQTSVHKYRRAIKILKDNNLVYHDVFTKKGGGDETWYKFKEATTSLIQAIQDEDPITRGADSEGHKSPTVGMTEGHRSPTVTRSRGIDHPPYKNNKLINTINFNTPKVRMKFEPNSEFNLKLNKTLGKNHIEIDSNNEIGEVIDLRDYSKDRKAQKVLDSKKGKSIDEVLSTPRPKRKLPAKITVTKLEFLWKDVCAEWYPDSIQVSWTGKEVGMAKSLLKRIPHKILPAFIQAVVSQWEDALIYVCDECSLKPSKKKANIGFIAGHPQEFLDWYTEEGQEATMETNKQDVHTHAQPKKKKADNAEARALFEKLGVKI